MSTMSIFLRFFLLLSLITSTLSGCRQQVYKQMDFQVNPSLLGSVTSDSILQINYAAPVSFNRLDNEQAFQQHSANAAPEAGVHIRAVYQDERTQAFMILSEVTYQRWQLLASSMASQAPEPASQVWETITTTTFSYHDFDVHQWLLQNQDWINFKLLYRAVDKRYFQVDYLMPVAFYDEFAGRAIESSIGSIKSK